MTAGLLAGMDPLDDLEDPASIEDEEADAKFSANLSTFVGAIAPDVPGMALSDEQTKEVLAELGGSDTLSVDSPCPKCGQEMEAQVDPASLLSFPMKYVWSCSCGHQEARKDKHVIDNPGADASMDGGDGDDLF